MTTERQPHRVEIIQQRTGTWTVRCSCGWINEGFTTQRAAVADADDHIIIMSRCDNHVAGDAPTEPAPLTADDKLTIAEALIDRARLFESYATQEWHTRAQEIRDLAQRFAAEVNGR